MQGQFVRFIRDFWLKANFTKTDPFRFWFRTLVHYKLMFGLTSVRNKRISLCTWKTVSMASPMLSKDVIPEFGPSHFSRQMETFPLQV